LVWIQPQPFTDFLFSFKMKAFIICLAAIATVSGDAKPWTIAQVANGEHIRNALAENRGHNIGVITNAAIAPTPHAVNSYGLASTVSHAYTYGAPAVYSYPSVYYGKRDAEAEPWTLAQVAAGEPAKNALAEGRLHNIGVITNAAEAGVTQVGGIALYNAVPAVHTAIPAVHSTVYYGKREAEPYTPAQVATGQTNGGLLTFVDHGHGTGHRPIVAAPVVYQVPAVHSTVHYGKREAKPYTLAQVAAGQTAGGVITSVGGHPVVPFRSIPAAYTTAAHVPHVYYG